MHISEKPHSTGFYPLTFISLESNVTKRVQSFLIETHLNSTNLSLFVPRSFERRSLTRWEWMKLSFKDREWRSLLFVAAKVTLCASLFFFVWNAHYLSSLTLCALLLVSVTILEMYLKAPNGLYLHTILLEKMNASLVDVEMDKLANLKKGEAILDPLTLDLLPHSPETLVVGAYALLAKDLLELTLTCKPAQKGEIRHPIEQRYLNEQEKEKLLNDLSSLLCIPKEALRSCWQPDRREFDEYINSVAREKYSLFWQDSGEPGREQVRGVIGPLLLPNFRQKKFLSLLPKPIVDKYFPWLNDFQEIELPEIVPLGLEEL